MLSRHILRAVPTRLPTALPAAPLSVAPTTQWIRHKSRNRPRGPGQVSPRKWADQYPELKRLKPDQPEADKKATPERNTPLQSAGAGPGVTQRTTVDPKKRAADFSEQQGEFDSPQSPHANTASESKPPGQSGPLPDLRQGIPSTFDAEFLKQATSKAEEIHARSDPNDITEAHEPQPTTSTGSGGSRDRGSGELPKSAYETSTDRRRNAMLNWTYVGGLFTAAVGVVYLGREWDNEAEQKAHGDVPNGWSPSLMWQRARARMSSQKAYWVEPTFPKLLPETDPPPPYTLVVSLEDLLIHSEWSREHGWRTAKRPGVDYFLRYLCQYYELVVFTSLPVQTADPVIKKLDPFHIITWPLFREATRYEKGEHVKDLSYLNRDLSKTIIIDTKPEHVKLQPENAIILPKWDGKPRSPETKDLVALIPFLEYIATMGIEDVRKAVGSFEGTHIPTEFARREALAREKFQEQLAAERAKRPKHSGLSFLTNALGMKPQGMHVDGASESAAEGFEKGKMLSDQIRERGMKQYEELERQIRENGAKWLEEMEKEEKKAMEEQMKSMKSGFTGWFGAGDRQE